MSHDPITCIIDLCTDCPPSCEGEAEYDDSAFGYTPGEDRCPAAQRILGNEAFLTDAELRNLITCHAACRAGLR